jgi:beta-glucanase (GH16 family)
MVHDKVPVSGRAPGFQNVEIWDATHTNPPLARTTPKSDGTFSTTVDASNLPSGATTWMVHAWDSAAGQSFMHSDEVDVPLTITTSASTGGGNDGTADPGTAYVPGGYKLTFSDEFDGSKLDTGKWNTLAPWGVQFYSDSHQQQAFIPEGVTLASGLASFTARKSQGNTGGQPYSSGSITTNGTFTHGYFEARVRVPAGKGFWPAYWLTSSSRWPPEWDIFEIIDGNIFGYTHPVSGGKCSFVEGAAGSDSTYTISKVYDVFHVYGFKWTATDIYWYVDGTMTEHYAIDSAAGANDPFWLNLSLQVGGDWPGNPDSSTPLPSHMDVDYVRVYTP